MRELELKTRSGACRVRIGPVSEAAGPSIEAGRAVLVVDSEVSAQLTALFPNVPHIVIPGGEHSKNLEIVESLYRFFLQNGLQRRDIVVAAGGGAVCDSAAFAAATYARGVRAMLIPTTLLAQVDAAIGGKNGVNFCGFKNLIGVFRQPELVVCDVTFLRNISDTHYREAFSELIKHGMILDRTLFELLESSSAQLLAREPTILEEVIERSVRVKAAVVSRDECEGHERVALNFGHTLAHALEASEGISHGKAVGIGLLQDTVFSWERGVAPAALIDRTCAVLSLYGLGAKLAVRNPEKFIAALAADKKRSGKMVKIALLRALGEHLIEEIPHEHVVESIMRYCSLNK